MCLLSFINEKEELGSWRCPKNVPDNPLQPILWLWTGLHTSQELWLVGQYSQWGPDMIRRGLLPLLTSPHTLH